MLRGLLALLLLLWSTTSRVTSVTDAGQQQVVDRLLDITKLNVDPCDDFSTYACGNWNSSVLLGSMWANTRQIVVEKLETIRADDPRTVRALKTVKRFYDACNREVAPDLVEELRLVQVTEYLSCRNFATQAAIDSFGGWPSMDTNWSEENVDDLWSDVGELVVQYGHFVFFTITSVPYQTDGTYKLGIASRADFRLFPDSRGNPALRERLRLVFTRYYKAAALRVYGSDRYNETIIDPDAEKAISLYTKFIEATFDTEDATLQVATQITQHFHLMSVVEMIERWPKINWPRLLIALGNSTGDLKAIFGSKINVDTKAVDIVHDMMSETRRTLQNMIAASFVISTSANLGIMKGLDETSTKSILNPLQDCVGTTLTIFPIAMSYVFASHTQLKRSDIDYTHGLITSLLTSWKGMMRSTDWLSDESTKAGLKKLSHVAQKVGYPEWLFDEGRLDEQYSAIELDDDDRDFVLYYKITRWKTWQDFSKIGKKVDRYAYLMSAADVKSGAWYIGNFNSITFPASNMRDPFFNTEWPLAWLYGGFGSVIGHEIGHGFDPKGVRYGPVGEYFNQTWFDESSTEGFERQSRCLIEDFNKYCKEDNENVCVNGANTIGENTADVAGILASYRAFKAMEKLGGVEPRLPHPNFSNLTSDQLFFLGWANTWCTTSRHISQKNVHSPAYVRVFAPLKHLEEFANAFNCQPGSKMSPAERCRTWH